MNRLPQGALIGRVTAVILASSLVISNTLPVVAANAGSQDPVLRPLAPVEDNQQASSNTPSDSNSLPLRYTRGDASSNKANELPDAWSTAPPPVSNKTDSSSNASAPQPVSSAKNDNDPSNGTAPQAVAANSTDNRDGDSRSNSGAPRAVAGNSDDNSSAKTPNTQLAQADDGDAKKQVAQAVPGTPRTITDPIYNHQPYTRGTVYLHRSFKLFPTDTIIHNLQFRDTPVREVIAELGSRGHLNIMLDKSVIGRITGDLHDMTLNEAMDTVLTSAGLVARQLDNSTIIIGEQASLTRLGLNRPIMKVFRLSYANSFDVASILHASVFNKGYLPDFTAGLRNNFSETSTETPTSRTNDNLTSSAGTATAGGGTQTSTHSEIGYNTTSTNTSIQSGDELSSTSHLAEARTVRNQWKPQTTEGTGFNNSGTDPGSETIRASTIVQTDFQVEQNGGGAIVIPDTKNHQVMVIGTPDDIAIAEEAIRLIDRRPRMIHIQSSLVEIDSTAIRQLGASLNVQGAGASGTVLGGSGAPMVNFLPGLGSATASTVTNTLSNAITGAGAFANSVTNNMVGISPLAQTFSQTLGNGFTVGQTIANAGLSPVSGSTTGISSGILGALLPAAVPSIANVTAATSALSGFNFLTLSKAAGGRANIATMPAGLNLSLNLALQTGKAKLLANPSVLVEDNTEALISLSNEVIHKVTTTASLGVISTNVELVKAGIFLDVLPMTTEDGFIVMRLRPSVSTPLGPVQTFANGTVLITLLNTREVLSQEVRVKDGQTLVLGGLFSEQEAATLSKIPYLSEAPILGALFRNSQKGRDRTELMMMITPKIVEEPPPNTLSESGGPAPAL